MDIFEALFTRRSIRKYTQEDVSDEDLNILLKAAMLAPSASNRQPWHFVVVRDPDVRAALAGQVAAYADLRSVNDFRVLLGTWFFDMHFAASRRQFVEDGHARQLLEGLPQNATYGPVRVALLKRLDGARERD